MNFTVISKRTGISYEVFAVKDAHFLIFFNGNFTWQPMNNFRPNKMTEQERMEKESPKSLLFKSQKKEVLYP